MRIAEWSEWASRSGSCRTARVAEREAGAERMRLRSHVGGYKMTSIRRSRTALQSCGAYRASVAAGVSPAISTDCRQSTKTLEVRDGLAFECATHSSRHSEILRECYELRIYSRAGTLTYVLTG